MQGKVKLIKGVISAAKTVLFKRFVEVKNVTNSMEYDKEV